MAYTFNIKTWNKNERVFFLLHSLIDSASLLRSGTVVSHPTEKNISIFTESLLERGTHSHFTSNSRNMTHHWQLYRSVYGYSASSEVCHAIWFLCYLLQVNYLRLVYSCTAQQTGVLLWRKLLLFVNRQLNVMIFFLLKT